MEEQAAAVMEDQATAVIGRAGKYRHGGAGNCQRGQEKQLLSRAV